MRILLRAAPDEDLWGEYETISEDFVAAGPEAELRARTEHDEEQWARARTTGSSRADGDGAFEDAGLIVQDAGDQRQRWLPRPHLADYLRALLNADYRFALLDADSGRRLQLTESLQEPEPAIFQRYHIGDPVLVLPDRSPGTPWTMGEVRDGRNPDPEHPEELLVKLSTSGEIRWFAPDQFLEVRYYATTRSHTGLPAPRHGHYEAGEIGLALRWDDQGRPMADYMPESVFLHLGGSARTEDWSLVPWLKGLDWLDRQVFVPRGRIREIDPGSVQAEVDEQGRVLRYVAGPAPGVSDVADRRRAERARWAQDSGSSSAPPPPSARREAGPRP